MPTGALLPGNALMPRQRLSLAVPRPNVLAPQPPPTLAPLPSPRGAAPAQDRGRLTQANLHADYALHTGAFGAPGDQGAGQHLVNIHAPNGATWQVNAAAAPQLQGFVNDLAAQGYDLRSGGGYNNRRIRGGSNWSEHAWGTAIDINPDENPMQDRLQTTWRPDIGDVAAKWGLKWGGSFAGRKDPMHFEVAASPDQLEPDVQKQLATFGPFEASAPPTVGQSVIDQRSQDLAQLNSAIFQRESSSGRNIAVSYAGARGPMQIMPQTWAQYAQPGEDIDNFADNMRVGRRIVGDLYDRYGGNRDAVLIGYNAGEKRIGLPWNQLPRQTQNYIIDSHRDWGDAQYNPATYQPYAGERVPFGQTTQVAQAGQPTVTDAVPDSHNEPPPYVTAPPGTLSGLTPQDMTRMSPLAYDPASPEQFPLPIPMEPAGSFVSAPPVAPGGPGESAGGEVTPGPLMSGLPLATSGAIDLTKPWLGNAPDPTKPWYEPSGTVSYAPDPSSPLYTGGAVSRAVAQQQTQDTAPGGPASLPYPGTQGQPDSGPASDVGGPSGSEGFKDPGDMTGKQMMQLLAGMYRGVPVGYDPSAILKVAERPVPQMMHLATPIPEGVPVTRASTPSPVASPFYRMIGMGGRGGVGEEIGAQVASQG